MKTVEVQMKRKKLKKRQNMSFAFMQLKNDKTNLQFETLHTFDNIQPLLNNLLIKNEIKVKLLEVYYENLPLIIMGHHWPF